MFFKIKCGIKKETHGIMNNIKKVWHEIVCFFKEKGKLKKIRKLLKKIWSFFTRKDVLATIVLALPFVIMDLTTRLFGNDIDFVSFFHISPRLFSLAYIILILGISLNTKSKHGKRIYFVSFLVFFIMFVVNNIYYSTMKNFFDFSLMSLASEGSDYFWDAIISSNIWVYVVIVVVIINFIYGLIIFPKKSFNKKGIIKVSIIFIILHIIAKMCLGFANFELTWNTWRNPRNVYDNFNDSNKCMAITGLYEYTIRDFYITYLKPEQKKSDTESKFLDEVFSVENDEYIKNSYTGKFKGKNVIFLQMEGIDNWLLTKDIMPNTYKLLDNSINFTNHYSYYNGGGSTFNSEFMVNVGYTTPFTYLMNAYSLNKNDFTYSMANLMKQENYSIKAFHMNSKEYYSRGINYSNWGYDRYFGLKDLGTYQDNTYYLDRELILNETFYDEMFKGGDKFVNYIITYSNHLPFSAIGGVSKKLLEIEYQDYIKDMTYDQVVAFFESLDLSEEECIFKQARETDNMVGLLIKALKDNNLYNDTIIVVYTDHYLYTASDEVLGKYKDTSNSLVNKTPFFIFSPGMKKQEINKVTSQLNILPTVLNLLGISYNSKWYLGRDALDKSYVPLVIFSDMSWYDGNVYVKDGIVVNNKKISDELLEEKNNYVAYLVKKNDLVLKYNYFKEIIK